ncbi:hypothetical protein [Pseudomonas sp. 2995-3]|uniref:hypothetical protein n=1 Tax=Pseudomonas sp. 2995-3 TaxID=1712680 RepID=UPI00117B8ECC|nr:hypothetical protein [Pseudomonas sp. 2995-3]
MDHKTTDNTSAPKIIIPESTGINYTGISHNTDTHVINITEDKLYRIIKDHHQALKRSRDWVTYFGIFLSLLASLTASSFNDFIFTANTWKTIFISAAAISFVSTFAAGWSRLRDKPVTPKILVDKIAGRIKLDG